MYLLVRDISHLTNWLCKDELDQIYKLNMISEPIDPSYPSHYPCAKPSSAWREGSY
jgi:hypothetical protein